MSEDFLNFFRCLLTLVAGFLPAVLVVAICVRRKWYDSSKHMFIVGSLLTFLVPFSFAFVGLLLNPRPRKLPWDENFLIALVFALVASGLAHVGWLVSRPFRWRKDDNEQKQ
jgi:drug/metabolite transporter (DMT)-like permease